MGFFGKESLHVVLGDVFRLKGSKNHAEMKNLLQVKIGSLDPVLQNHVIDSDVG